MPESSLLLYCLSNLSCRPRALRVSLVYRRPGRQAGGQGGVRPRGWARASHARRRPWCARRRPRPSAQSGVGGAAGDAAAVCGVMGASHVPPFLLDALLRQLLGFINTKMMNRCAAPRLRCFTTEQCFSSVYRPVAVYDAAAEARQHSEAGC